MAGPVADHGSGGGEGAALAGALEQGQAELAFEAAESFAGGGLADLEFGRGGADAAELGDADEQAQ